MKLPESSSLILRFLYSDLSILLVIVLFLLTILKNFKVGHNTIQININRTFLSFAKNPDRSDELKLVRLRDKKDKRKFT